MSAAQNVWNELLSTKRLRGTGDLNKLRAKLWYCLNAAMVGLNAGMTQEDSEEVRRWLTAITQLSHAYAKVTIDGDIERRLRELETTMTERDAGDVSAPYSPARRR